MNIVVTYGIDKDLYDNSEHRVSLVTTEYSHINDTLVRLQIGKNLGIRLNNLLSHDFKTNTVFQNEQFLFKKAYKQGKAKPITRSTFEDKMKRFDMSHTVTEREILEEYAYKGKDGRFGEAQIVIRVKDDEMIAVIDFKDVEQYNNFVPPAWLVRLNPAN